MGGYDNGEVQWTSSENPSFVPKAAKSSMSTSFLLGSKKPEQPDVQDMSGSAAQSAEMTFLVEPFPKGLFLFSSPSVLVPPVLHRRNRSGRGTLEVSSELHISKTQRRPMSFNPSRWN